MKRHFLLAICFAVAAFANAEDIRVTTFRHVGPLPLLRPVQIDTTDVNGKAFDEASLLATPLDMSCVRDAKATTDSILATATDDRAALHLAAFTMENTAFTKVTINISGLKHHELYVDGTKGTAGTETELVPGTHEVVIKALTTTAPDTMSVTLHPATEGTLHLVTDATKRLYTLNDVLHARRYTGVQLSPDARWMLVSTMQTQPGGETQYMTELREVATGRATRLNERPRWMPRTNSYIFDRTRQGHRELVALNPATGSESILCRDLPEGYYDMLPTEDRLVFTLYDNAPAERDDVYEVIHPDDRQPGWRTRTHQAIYDLRTGMMQPLTFGHSQTYLTDVSLDGRYALVETMTNRMGERPTELASLLRIDLETLQADTLLTQQGFVGMAQFSPDGRQVLISGSPEALNGISKNVGPDQTPSMIDTQLFLMDIDSRDVRALTRDFNPNVGRVAWSQADGMIYFKAEDRDSVNLFRLDPQRGEFLQLALPEELVEGFDIAASAKMMAVYAQSASNSDRLYLIDLAKVKGRSVTTDLNNNCPIANCQITQLEDLSTETLRDITLGECQPYTYTNERGEAVSCRYYLPPYFDASRSYPMIVNYYGGCSPTSRNFETRYPQHAYAALGYVVLVVNPRGATGFGQRWSASHVNTAGEGVAEDIIGAVKAFCRDHAWVDSKKIGCIGASYGGFMTQYLQTKTDIFAAAISHAGISDHTSYWGEGYWGYTYSQVSMANSYPWTRRDLYVEQSPLFNADKIHTPLLFLHGDADHNVPVGESIQMYTALKLLGCPTAMVLVKDQDHHISDYNKRIRWQNTIWAWFARYLQDDLTWWQSMYPDKDL